MLANYRSKNWAKASAALKAAEKLQPDGLDVSGLYALYRERIAEFKKDPPPGNWDGVYVATRK